jgi:ferredoxin
VVHLDPTRCRGHGICALFFPDGVELDQWGYGRSLEVPVEGSRAAAKARRAARACPNGAISYEVIDDRTGDSVQLG